MPDPVTILTGAMTGLAGLITAIGKLADNPVIAYFLVISVLIADAGVSGMFNHVGVVGTILTLIVNQLGLNWVIYSWYLVVIIGILPLIAFSIKASAFK